MIYLIIILGLAALILVHELGHFAAAKLFGVRVDEFSIGFPPRIVKKRIGETVYSIGALFLGGYVKIFGENGEQSSEEAGNARNFASKSLLKRSVILLAGVGMNIVFGWLILSGVFMVGSPQQVVITEIAPESPAAAAGVEHEDIIKGISAEGEKLSGELSVASFVSFVGEHTGKLMTMDVVRGEKLLSFELTARERPPEGEGSLGVTLAGIGIPKKPVLQALVSGLEATGIMLKNIFIGFGSLIKGIFVDRAVLENVAGPVGIFTLATNAGSFGLVYLFEFLAIISLNLAVLNLIPFPALDGGRFLVLLVEGARGVSVSFRAQQIINLAGLAALLLLVILVTIQDIARLV